MESRDLLTWAHNLLHNTATGVPGHAELLGASSAMLEFFELCDANPAVLDLAVQQQLFDAALRCLLMLERAGVSPTPKHHSFLHLAQRTGQ